MRYLDVFILFFSLLFLLGNCFRNRNGFPTNWPLVGMLPALLSNINHIHDALVELAAKSQLTFPFKGPWLTGMKVLFTVDPTNVHYILSKNFGNYHMGSKFNEIFDELMGEGPFIIDSDWWMQHRKFTQSFLNHPRFHQCLSEKIWQKIEGGLIPILDHVSKHGLEINLQDLLQRFTFDIMCSLVMDHDPRSLSLNSPSVPFLEAIKDAEEVIHRFAVPTCIWKCQRWLSIGQEKKNKRAIKILDGIVYKLIAAKRNEMSEKKDRIDVGTDVLTSYLKDEDVHSDKCIRSTIIFYLAAGQDTIATALSWFFYLLSKNKQVVSKIKEELATTMVQVTKDDYDDSKLIYLHAALCEALRLYPPVVFEARSPISSDTLPSGHRVDPSTLIIINLSVMGRMKSIWGDDCYEFKPERWISEKGKIRHEPSYKFLTFNAGPKTCLGKNMSFILMKVVVAAIISKYNFEAVEGHQVVPDVSMVLHMKYGFKVKVISSSM